MNKTVFTTLILIAFAALAGCGNNGALFLPDPPRAEVEEATVEPVLEDEPPGSDDEETVETPVDDAAGEDPADDANG